MARSKKRKRDKVPQFVPKARRKAGATGTRLTYTAAPSREIRARQRKVREPQPVIVRFVEPAELRKTAKKR